MALAGLWDDIRGAISPQARVIEGGRIEVPVGNDGHYHLTAQVNGTPVRFVIDTGASSIALGPADAARVGIDPQALAYAGQARTANGVVETATVLLDSVVIGEIRDSRVPALVLRADLGQSLMGMSYLSRFARVSIEGNRLVLER
ncbi:retropepsin-like aspartic protease family protein [Paracoccus thiocyanatus]|uniref:retropepsin-like aspartic protease family protein n=1 Tax=Paracoccus thiocyanatus TaxID=34006 RepID=UPI0028690080|nr:TIGR02281 family clan AA aspartic protease [Paracoccus thiocyanatus]